LPDVCRNDPRSRLAVDYGTNLFYSADDTGCARGGVDEVGDGVIYAIAENGDLLWFRHDGRGDGSFRWTDDKGRKVGVEWNFKYLFSS
jgi:hypothetical protein